MPPIATLDTVIVGAGVVGLACARALARPGCETVVLEAAEAIGTGTSSRNSEVIHAGLYYPTGSLKARLCVEGRDALVAYCRERGIEHRLCGKLVVATDDAQVSYLRKLHAQALANGVDDAVLVDGAQARAWEPALAPGVVAALHSPATGIVDSHQLMLSFQGDAQAADAVVAFRSPLVAGRVVEGGIELEVGGEQSMRVRARRVVNAGGLAAPAIAARIEGLAPRHVPEARFCKGSYFSLAGRAPFGRLIYPVPEPGGLGVHLTLDAAGQARFGPDVEWLAGGDAIDYAVDPARGERFVAEIRRYWPGLPDGALVPAYSGVRPKISGPGEPAADFVISGPAEHGVPGLVNLFGIESPGLTSSMAIARRVAELLG